MPTVFQEQVDRTLNYQTPVRLDDIIVVRREEKEKHRGKLFTILKQIQEAIYRAFQNKFETFLKETTCLGYGCSKKETKLKREKIKAILQLKDPTKIHEVKSFFGAFQYIAKTFTQI